MSRKKTKSLAEVLEDFLQKMDVPASFVENFLKKKEEGLVDQKILWFGEEKRDDIEKAAKSGTDDFPHWTFSPLPFSLNCFVSVTVVPYVSSFQ